MAELYAELAEIDENLIRNDLTELQQGLQHARRKAIYEKLHPETAIPGRGKNQYVPTDNMSVGTPTYAADAANAVGETERTVRRKTRIGEQLAAVAEQLQATAIEDNQSELLALAKLQETKPEIAAQVINELVKTKQPTPPAIHRRLVRASQHFISAHIPEAAPIFRLAVVKNREHLVTRSAA